MNLWRSLCVCLYLALCVYLTHTSCGFSLSGDLDSYTLVPPGGLAAASLVSKQRNISLLIAFVCVCVGGRFDYYYYF